MFVDDGRIGDGLSNAGDQVRLIDPGRRDTVASLEFGSAEGQSLVRNPAGGTVLHGTWPGRGAFSPGRARPVVSNLWVSPGNLTLWRGQTAVLRAVVVFSDAAVDTITGGILWEGESGSPVVVDPNGKVTALNVGAGTVRVRAGSLTADAIIRVENPPNRAPVVTTLILGPVRAGGAFHGRVTATDPDGDALIFSLIEGPEWIRIDSETGSIEGKAGEAPGEAGVAVRVEDGRGGRVERRFALAVLPRRRVVIDEVLAAPPEGPEGDVNRDGVRDGYQDEFVELLNADSTAVDLGGWSLADDDTPPQRRFRFPAGAILAPGGRAVVFGGGRPAGVPGLVFADDGRIGDGLSKGGTG